MTTEKQLDKLLKQKHINTVKRLRTQALLEHLNSQKKDLDEHIRHALDQLLQRPKKI